jgi:hypothetical protein
MPGSHEVKLTNPAGWPRRLLKLDAIKPIRCEEEEKKSSQSTEAWSVEVKLFSRSRAKAMNTYDVVFVG